MLITTLLDPSRVMRDDSSGKLLFHLVMASLPAQIHLANFPSASYFQSFFFFVVVVIWFQVL